MLKLVKIKSSRLGTDPRPIISVSLKLLTISLVKPNLKYLPRSIPQLNDS